jgi:hypothetical protein
MAQPSTEWKENIEQDETERFTEEADIVGAIQQKYNRQYHCPGRAFHRKQLLATKAVFEVLDELPPYARFGVFARPRTFDSLVRLSNASARVYDDTRPDIRGFAIKVLGVEGKDALSGDPAKEHNILMVQTDPFGARSLDFIRFVQMTDSKEGDDSSAPARAFSGFMVDTFHTQTPFCVGPYAARGRLKPPRGQTANPNASNSWGADVVSRLPLTWEYQLQFYMNDTDTPIDNATKSWNETASPYVTVARLTIPAQEVTPEWTDEVNEKTFLLWNTIQEHRPLGEVNRARRVVMSRSVENRRSLNRPEVDVKLSCTW